MGPAIAVLVWSGVLAQVEQAPGDKTEAARAAEAAAAAKDAAQAYTITTSDGGNSSWKE